MTTRMKAERRGGWEQGVDVFNPQNPWLATVAHGRSVVSMLRGELASPRLTSPHPCRLGIFVQLDWGGALLFFVHELQSKVTPKRTRTGASTTTMARRSSGSSFGLPQAAGRNVSNPLFLAEGHDQLQHSPAAHAATGTARLACNVGMHATPVPMHSPTPPRFLDAGPVVLHPGARCVALEVFEGAVGPSWLASLEAHPPDVLPLEVHDEVVLVSAGRGDWWVVRDRAGRTGSVPTSKVHVAVHTGVPFDPAEVGTAGRNPLLARAPPPAGGLGAVYPAGSQAVAVDHFTEGVGEHELPVEVGQLVRIIEAGRGKKWWKVNNAAGVSGYVFAPRNLCAVF